MKKTIKDFLFKRRFKLLKNKKGFSLLEVLVAVGIIAIISAIAVPQLTGNKKQAAIVVGDTSISNIMRAYNQCIALKATAQCSDLSALEVTCPDCDSEFDATNGFCAHIRKTVGNDSFAACVNIDGSVITRSYGGALISEGKICHKVTTASTTPGNCAAKPKTAIYPIKACDNAVGSTGKVCATTQQAATATACGVTYSCDNVGTATTAGTCNSSAQCQF